MPGKLINQSGYQAFCRTAGLVVIALLHCFFTITAAWAAEVSEVTPEKPAEYMIYQYPGVAMLIRIDAVETEFEARVYGTERALIKASRVPSRRIGPVYQLIEAIDTARQLIVEVIPSGHTDRSRISMELVQLPQDERSSLMQSEAFRLMSRAMDSTSANDSTTWAMKVYALKSAAYAFEQLGWEELRLWSEYYAAHLTFYKLHDELSAIELAREVQIAARRAGFGVIEMATLQLEGTALLNAAMSGPGQSAEDRYSETHRVLERVSVLADDLGFQSERGLALFSDGMAWEQQEDLTQALKQYRRALEIANSAGDTELSNEIRNKAAFAYEAQGSVSGAIEMLDQIGSELSEDSAALELAESLYEKGRILNSSYRYAEAVDVLAEALSLQESNGANSRLGRTGLEMGYAFYGMGLFDRAASALQESIYRTSTSRHQQDLRSGLGMLAAIYRFQGDFAAMSKARDEQAAFVNSETWRARHTYERALDLLASSGPSSHEARTLLRQSYQLARSSADGLLEHRVLLQMCSYGSNEIASNQQCSQAIIQQAVDFLQTVGIPRYALEARFAHSRFLRRQGRLTQAISSSTRLIDEIRYFRRVLPGVLGGWYWESRDHVFDEHISMILQQSRSNGGDLPDGLQILLAIERLRSISGIDRQSASTARARDVEPEFIRSMLAARDEASGQAASLQLPPESSDVLNKNMDEFFSSEPSLTVEKLNSLLWGLPKRSSLLTYYFSGGEIHAIVAGRSSVRMVKLSSAPKIYSSLENLRQNLGNRTAIIDGQLEALGQLMVEPVIKLLPESVYLLPSGPLNGFPFDLLRLNGRYLAEQHEFINLVSVTSLANPFVRVNTRDIDLFFLAGDPQAKREVFNYEQNLSAEILTVTDVFVGPALHIVQGSALKRDEFEDDRFENANVIHLAIPGTISLDSPAQSALILSGSGTTAGGEYLRPVDFQLRRFKASLVVLSATRVQGISFKGFNNHLGFVTDMLHSGVNAVVASLWTIEDQDRANFMAAFYHNLAIDPDVAMALHATKRQFMKQADRDNISLWAGFQVYLN